MKVTNDVAKTRAQKEKLDEISTPSQEDKPPRMPREGTMAVTAKVYIDLQLCSVLNNVVTMALCSKQEITTQ